MIQQCLICDSWDRNDTDYCLSCSKKIEIQIRSESGALATQEHIFVWLALNHGILKKYFQIIKAQNYLPSVRSERSMELIIFQQKKMFELIQVDAIVGVPSSRLREMFNLSPNALIQKTLLKLCNKNDDVGMGIKRSLFQDLFFQTQQRKKRIEDRSQIILQQWKWKTLPSPKTRFLIFDDLCTSGHSLKRLKHEILASNCFVDVVFCVLCAPEFIQELKRMKGSPVPI